jgi:hypothetical protein
MVGEKVRSQPVFTKLLFFSCLFFNYCFTVYF